MNTNDMSTSQRAQSDGAGEVHQNHTHEAVAAPFTARRSIIHSAQRLGRSRCGRGCASLGKSLQLVVVGGG